MLSKASSKSIKSMCKEDCHSMWCSSDSNPKLWSVQLQPAQNSACSSHNFPSNAFLICSKIILQNTLLAMFKSMIPPDQFLQWLCSLFFGRLISKHFFHLSDTCSLLHIWSQRSKGTASDNSSPALTASGGILSHRAAFLTSL